MARAMTSSISEKPRSEGECRRPSEPCPAVVPTRCCRAPVTTTPPPLVEPETVTGTDCGAKCRAGDRSLGDLVAGSPATASRRPQRAGGFASLPLGSFALCFLATAAGGCSALANDDREPMVPQKQMACKGRGTSGLDPPKGGHAHDKMVAGQVVAHIVVQRRGVARSTWRRARSQRFSTCGSHSDNSGR
jgi:hypothetical protein